LAQQSSINRGEKEEPLYFIAIIPGHPVYDEALKLKHYFKDRYNSKAALNSPPHITLHMPFKWKKKKEEILIDHLTNFSKSHTSGKLHLMGFNAFPPRVIYIDVVKNDWLDNLQLELQRFCKKELNLFNANYKEHPFHPHLTLAFRDLKKQNFVTAWEEFKVKKFESVFEVNSIVLLKHDEKAWQPYASFNLLTND
jgi:2'-5' RNA ligase